MLCRTATSSLLAMACSLLEPMPLPALTILSSPYVVFSTLQLSSWIVVNVLCARQIVLRGSRHRAHKYCSLRSVARLSLRTRVCRLAHTHTHTHWIMWLRGITQKCAYIRILRYTRMYLVPTIYSGARHSFAHSRIPFVRTRYDRRPLSTPFHKAFYRYYIYLYPNLRFYAPVFIAYNFLKVNFHVFRAIHRVSRVSLTQKKMEKEMRRM